MIRKNQFYESQLLVYDSDTPHMKINLQLTIGSSFLPRHVDQHTAQHPRTKPTQQHLRQSCIHSDIAQGTRIATLLEVPGYPMGHRLGMIRVIMMACSSWVLARGGVAQFAPHDGVLCHALMAIILGGAGWVHADLMAGTRESSNRVGDFESTSNGPNGVSLACIPSSLQI
jgi:hypothetical protein